MGYRNIYVKSALKLSLKDNSLIVTKDDGQQIVISLEDIASLLIEDRKTVVTTRLLAALAEYYITMIVCDDNYLPASITLPLNMHYKQLGVFKMQCDVKKPVLNQVWSRIIDSKISNHLAVINKYTPNEEVEDRIDQERKAIQSGDKTNREAVCAKMIFNALYGRTFIRNHNNHDSINSAMNYGYSLLAGHVSRVLCMYGFNTNIGIHHDSLNNNNNLSYDFVEPFRAYVDEYIYCNLDNLTSPLNVDIRKGLIYLLQTKTIINNKYYSLQFAIEEMIKSYIDVLKAEDSSKLLLPRMEVIKEDGNTDEL